MLIKLLTLIVLTSCSIQEKQKKSFLGRLNGNNSSNVDSINIGSKSLSIPIRTKFSNTKIKGLLRLALPNDNYKPLRGAKISITDNQDKLITSSISSFNGHFQLSARIDDGFYNMAILYKGLKVYSDRIKVEGYINDLGFVDAVGL